MSFGFSVGDFLAALDLVVTVIDALRDSGNASSQNRELLRELYSLETALIRVKRLDVDDELQAEVIALRQAAGQCQKTIEEFWKKICKYQPHLQRGGSTSRAKDGWMRIQWALCKQDDVTKFKADLVAHTQSIQVLLTTIHMSSTSLHDRKQEQRHQTLAGKIQISYNSLMQNLAIVATSVSRSLEQGKQMLEMTSEVIQMNVKVFQIVLNVQRLIAEIPSQVQRQQPVFLIDALGKASPFHLEFIRSPDALVAVLAENFRKYGRGADLIKNGDFVISDAGTDRDIDLLQEWELCFSPGQHVNMSMIFEHLGAPSTYCPRCQHNCRGRTDEDIECPKCGLIFRRFIDEGRQEVSPNTPAGSRYSQMMLVGPELPKGARKQSTDFNQELALYQRVRIRNYLMAFLRHKKLEFDDALSYVGKVEAQFFDRPDSYRRFLDILRTYERESWSIRKTYTQIMDLFVDQPDLLEEFKLFLPNEASVVSREEHPNEDQRVD